jgi:hypothetical protein
MTTGKLESDNLKTCKTRRLKPSADIQAALARRTQVGEYAFPETAQIIYRD